MAALSSPRRIVTSNYPIPHNLAQTSSSEPAVQVVIEELARVSELGGHAARHTVFTHETLPTSNNGLNIVPQEIKGGGVAIPGGANIRYNDIAPGGRVPMHRTGTTDYDIFLVGSVVLITPDEAYNPATGKGRLLETVCHPGDVVVQRGALHAWENRSTEWVRFLSVLIGAEPTTVAVDGSDGETVELPDCFGV